MDSRDSAPKDHFFPHQPQIKKVKIPVLHPHSQRGCTAFKLASLISYMLA